MSETSSTQIRLPTDLMNKIKELSEKNERSLNWQLTKLIRLGMKEIEEHGITAEQVRQIVRDELERAE